MSKKAFTLIETLVSVVILSSVAVALFEISSSSKSNFSFLQKKSDFTTLSSLALNHNNQNSHNKDIDLYSFIKYDYNIKDDELRRYLKSKKVHYEHEEFTTFSPLSEGGDTKQDIIDFTLIFEKVTIRTKQQSAFIYKIYMRE